MTVLVWKTFYYRVRPQAADVHLGKNHAVPLMASFRVQWWALTLSAYDYSIIYKADKSHFNADLLSCIPLPVSPAEC